MYIKSLIVVSKIYQEKPGKWRNNPETIIFPDDNIWIIVSDIVKGELLIPIILCTLLFPIIITYIIVSNDYYVH